MRLDHLLSRDCSAGSDGCREGLHIERKNQVVRNGHNFKRNVLVVVVLSLFSG